MSKNPFFSNVSKRFAHLSAEELQAMWLDSSRPRSEREGLREALWVKLWEACEPQARKRLSGSRYRFCGAALEDRTSEALADVMLHADTILKGWKPGQGKLATYAFRWVQGSVGDLLGEERSIHVPEGVRAALNRRPLLKETKERICKELVDCERLGKAKANLEQNLKSTCDELDKLNLLASLESPEKEQEDKDDDAMSGSRIERVKGNGYGSAGNIEARTDLKKVLRTCKKEQVKAWELVESGYSHREAGKIMGISHTMVGKHNAAVNSRLRELTA